MRNPSSRRTSFLVALPALTMAAACGVKAPDFVSSRTPSLDPRPLPARLPAIDDGVTAAASLEPELPDPGPPAYLDEKGKPQGPGGPISTQKRDCGPAQNHCLRGSGWFTDAFETGEVADPRVPVFQLEGHWYSWKGGHQAKGRVFRTRPATAATIERAKEVYVYSEAPDGSATFDSSRLYGVFPESEQAALTVRRWTSVRPYEIDAAAGTFVDNHARRYKIAAARVAFDMREVD